MNIKVIVCYQQATIKLHFFLFIQTKVDNLTQSFQTRTPLQKACYRTYKTISQYYRKSALQYVQASQTKSIQPIRDYHI